MMTQKTSTSKSITGYQIDRKPLIYYRISVMNLPDRERTVTTEPISMWCDDALEPFEIAAIDNGSLIIDNIPALPGSSEVGVWLEPNGEWEILGYEIPGMPTIDWDKRASALIDDMLNLEQIAGTFGLRSG